MKNLMLSFTVVTQDRKGRVRRAITCTVDVEVPSSLSDLEAMLLEAALNHYFRYGGSTRLTIEVSERPEDERFKLEPVALAVVEFNPRRYTLNLRQLQAPSPGWSHIREERKLREGGNPYTIPEENYGEALNWDPVNSPPTHHTIYHGFTPPLYPNFSSQQERSFGTPERYSFQPLKKKTLHL